MTTKDIIFYEVFMQRPYEAETLHSILTNIATLSSRGAIVWEVRCKNCKVRYLLGTPKKSIGKVQEVFSAHSEVQYSKAEHRDSVEDARKIHISKPILSLNTDVSSAMIRAVLAAMLGARADTESVVQIIFGAAFAPKTVPKNMADPNATWLDALLGNVKTASQECRRSAKDKAEQYSFDAVIRIGMTGEHTTTRLNNIVSAMRTLESAGVHIHSEKESPENLNNMVLPWRMPLRLSVKEIVCFMLLPAGEEEIPGTPSLHPKLLLPPKWYKEPTDNKNSRVFAVSTDSDHKKLSISPKDALEHTSLLGPTGSGKSTVLQHLILSDIKAGRSVLVIDPKADLVTDILERIPDERKDDVVVLDPSDPSPVGFNPLAYNQDPSLTADSILAVFQEIFSQNWGIRSADILSGALLTLAQVKGANLLWLPQLLTDESFRKRITSQVNDPIALQPFWEHFEAMKDSERRTEIAPVLNKLRQITYRPGLRNVLGQSEPRFSLTDLFYKRKIVLVPLNRGIIGAESAKLLGSLIVGLTWSLELSRAKIPPEKRHTVSVYIDELQDYLALPTSFSDALAQARGLGVAYTVAHQYRGQLPPDIKTGIDANCRNMIVFGPNSDDAKDMAAQAPELQALDFMSLPRYHIYTSFQSCGKSTGWISGQTLPPSPPLRLAAELKAESMKRYGVPAEQTEAELIQMMTRQEPQPDPNIINSPIGRKRKE